MASYFTTHNLSFTTIPLAYCLCLAPHIYAVLTYQSHQNSQTQAIQKTYPFQKSAPRTFLSTLSANPALPQSLKDKLSRAEAASLNGYENLGFFAAAVVGANLGLVVSGQKGLWLTNVLSIGYCVSRVVYIVAYTRGVIGIHRGVYYYAGVGCCIHLCVMAGRAMNTLITKGR